MPLALLPSHIFGLFVTGVRFAQADSISACTRCASQSFGNMVLCCGVVVAPTVFVFHSPSGVLISTIASYTPFASGPDTTSFTRTSPLISVCPPVTLPVLAL